MKKKKEQRIKTGHVIVTCKSCGALEKVKASLQELMCPMCRTHMILPDDVKSCDYCSSQGD